MQDAEALIDGSTEAERAAREVQRREQAAEAARQKAAEGAAAAARAATWDAEEVRLLEKALVKFPVVSMASGITLRCSHALVVHWKL